MSSLIAHWNLNAFERRKSCVSRPCNFSFIYITKSRQQVNESIHFVSGTKLYISFGKWKSEAPTTFEQVAYGMTAVMMNRSKFLQDKYSRESGCSVAFDMLGFTLPPHSHCHLGSWRNNGISTDRAGAAAHNSAPMGSAVLCSCRSEGLKHALWDSPVWLTSSTRRGSLWRDYTVH